MKTTALRKSSCAKFKLAGLIVLTLVAFSTVAKAQFTTDDNGSGGLIITGYTGTSTDIVVPSTINSKPVTGIGDAAFYRMEITSLTLPDSLTSIGINSFDGCQIPIITIPANVTSLGVLAFGDDGAYSIVFAGNAPSVGWGTFPSDPLFTLYYKSTAIGFVSPTWTYAQDSMDGGQGTWTATTVNLGTKTAQTISNFAPIPTKPNGAAPFTVAIPAASSGLPVTLSVYAGPATLSGNTLTITGVGTVILTANQSGNSTYGVAPQMVTSFQVKDADIVFKDWYGEIYGYAFNPDFSLSVSGIDDEYFGDTTYRFAAIGDVNGDGVPDAFFQTGTELDANLSGSAEIAVYGSVGAGWELRAAADIDGDGRAELIFQNGTQIGYLSVDADGFPSAWRGIGVMNAGWSLRAAGDLTGSGHPDLIFQNGNLIGAVKLNGNGAPVSWAGIGAMNDGWVLGQAVDINGDGRSDLVFQNGSVFGAIELDGAYHPTAWHGMGTFDNGATMTGDF